MGAKMSDGIPNCLKHFGDRKNQRMVRVPGNGTISSKISYHW